MIEAELNAGQLRRYDNDAEMWSPRLRRRRFDGFHFERSPFHRCGLNLLWFHNRRIRFSHKHPQIEFPSRQRLWWSLDHVESKCYGSTNETIECCETETQIGCGRRTGRNPPDVTRAGSSRQQHPDRLVSRCFDRWIGLVTRARAASGKSLSLSPKAQSKTHGPDRSI